MLNLFLIVIFGAGYFTWEYRDDILQMSNVNDLPIVRASDEPFKVRPAEPALLPLRSTTTSGRFSPRGIASSAAGYLHGGGIACCSLSARGASAASTSL